MWKRDEQIEKKKITQRKNKKEKNLRNRDRNKEKDI